MADSSRMSRLILGVLLLFGGFISMGLAGTAPPASYMPYILFLIAIALIASAVFVDGN
jgi:hypothetical protein